MKKKNILITGSPGVGKTTFVLKLLERLRTDADGFYTQEIREGSKRVGFELCTLEGKRGVLAHINIRSPLRVGRYGVELRSLDELGVKAMARAIRSRSLVIIDEIGKMELCSTKFRRSVLHALDSSAPVLATIGPQPILFLKEIRSRPDADVIELTRANRDDLVDDIQSLLDRR